MKLIRQLKLVMAAILAAMFAFSGHADAITGTELCSYAPAEHVKSLLSNLPVDTETSGPQADEDRLDGISTACQFTAGGRAVVLYLVEFKTIDAAKDNVQREFKAAAKDKSASVNAMPPTGLGDEAYQASGPDALMYIARKGTRVFATGVIGASISAPQMQSHLLEIAKSVGAHL